MLVANTFLGGQAAAVAPDYTPDAVDWTDVTAGSVGTGFVTANTNSQTITGINQPITLKISWTGSTALAININGTATALGNSAGSFSPAIHNGDVVYFTPNTFATSKSGTVTVQNSSDTGTPTLDTFNYTLTIS